nr:hypothetical protein GCM10025699_65200 [Microbacterium flavescens]
MRKEARVGSVVIGPGYRGGRPGTCPARCNRYPCGHDPEDPADPQALHGREEARGAPAGDARVVPDHPLTRDEFAALSAEPPEWLAELRRTGPHPRPVVAQKLGVTISGLARAGVDDALTTDEIHALLEEMPAWLVTERANLAEVREEEQRVKDRDAGRALLRAERERAEAADQS